MFIYKFKSKPLRKFPKETQKFIVYKHTNKTNGKCYVGKTSKTIEKRWNGHVRNSKKDNSLLIFHNAIRKYGADNWEHEVLEEVKSELFANASEIYWIEKFQSANREFGYNMTNGGDGLRQGYKPPPEVGEKISKANKGRKLTDEHSNKISEALIGREFSDDHRKHLSQTRMGEDNSFFGKTHTDEFKSNLSARMSKPVSQYDKQGNFIATYKSITVAIKHVGSGHISSVCNGERKTACGFIWKWA